ncbi:MAG: hypothetical protein ACTSV1_05015 [Alphaproteobacteria bacterium]
MTDFREATVEDSVEATALLAALGLVMPDGADAARAHWRRFWIDNPAFIEGRRKPQPGWVLQDDGRMVGFFGNIPLLYYYGDRPVIVADASQWGIEKPYRADVDRLADAYFGQPDVDLLLVTTGIKPTGRIFERYGAARIGQADYDRVLYWITDATGFLRAGLRKKGYGATLASMAALAGGLPLALLKGGRPRGGAVDIDLLNISDIDDGFDDLWQRKRGEADRLLACRTAACLRWHFDAPGIGTRTRLLVARKNRRLDGYAAIMREDQPEIGLKRLKIVDLFVDGDDAGVIDGLLAEAYELARAEGCHVLELVGLPEPLRRMVSAHNPLTRAMPTWPLYYKAVTADLAAPLARAESWYITPFDGDTALA